MKSVFFSLAIYSETDPSVFFPHLLSLSKIAFSAPQRSGESYKLLTKCVRRPHRMLLIHAAKSRDLVHRQAPPTTMWLLKHKGDACNRSGTHGRRWNLYQAGNAAAFELGAKVPRGLSAGKAYRGKEGEGLGISPSSGPGWFSPTPWRRCTRPSVPWCTACPESRWWRLLSGHLPQKHKHTLLSRPSRSTRTTVCTAVHKK